MIEFSTAERINPASLKSLWHDSFSEDYQSINLFFNSMYLLENTLIAFNGDTLVSALYLLPGKISTGNGQYSSIYYIFAAATNPYFRRRGIMRELLAYAAESAHNRGKSALCLLPGEESLYKYYERCGFRKYFTARKVILSYKEPIQYNIEYGVTAENLFSFREKILKDSPGNILFPSEHMTFALKYQDYISMDRGYAIISDVNKDRCIVSEFLTTPDCFELLFSKICEFYPARSYELYTPAQCMKSTGFLVPRGMILPINDFHLPEGNAPYLGLALD